MQKSKGILPLLFVYLPGLAVYLLAAWYFHAIEGFVPFAIFSAIFWLMLPLSMIIGHAKVGEKRLAVFLLLIAQTSVYVCALAGIFDFPFASLLQAVPLGFGLFAVLGSRKVYLAMSTLLLLLGVLLATFSPADWLYRRGFPNNFNIYNDPEIDGLMRYAPDLTAETTWRGDLAAFADKKINYEPKPYYLETDGRGLSNLHAMQEQEEIDVITIGDSYTTIISRNHWISLLFRDYGHAIYNLAMPGYGPADEYYEFRRGVERLQPGPGTTVLWCIFAGNDLQGKIKDDYHWDTMERNGFWKSTRIRIENYRRDAVLASDIVWYAWDRYFDPEESAGGPPPSPDNVVTVPFLNDSTLMFLKGYTEGTDLSVQAVKNHPNYPKLRSLFGEMRRFAAGLELNIKVVIFPSKADVYSWVWKKEQPWCSPRQELAIAQVFRELAMENGFACFDLYQPALAAAEAAYEKNEEILWWYEDTHWNDAGNAFAAKYIHEHVLK